MVAFVYYRLSPWRRLRWSTSEAWPALEIAHVRCLLVFLLRAVRRDRSFIPLCATSEQAYRVSSWLCIVLWHLEEVLDYFELASKALDGTMEAYELYDSPGTR